MRHPLGRSVVPSPMPPGSAAGGGADWARGRSAPRVAPAATIKPSESTHFHRRDPKLMRDTAKTGVQMKALRARRGTELRFRRGGANRPDVTSNDYLYDSLLELRAFVLLRLSKRIAVCCRN